MSTSIWNREPDKPMKAIGLYPLLAIKEARLSDIWCSVQRQDSRKLKLLYNTDSTSAYSVLNRIPKWTGLNTRYYWGFWICVLVVAKRARSLTWTRCLKHVASRTNRALCALICAEYASCWAFQACRASCICIVWCWALGDTIRAYQEVTTRTTSARGRNWPRAYLALSVTWNACISCTILVVSIRAHNYTFTSIVEVSTSAG